MDPARGQDGGGKVGCGAPEVCWLSRTLHMMDVPRQKRRVPRPSGTIFFLTLIFPLPRCARIELDVVIFLASNFSKCKYRIFRVIVSNN